MERYYDLEMANRVKEFESSRSLGVAPAGASEAERWEVAKKELSGLKLGTITEWGFIDFDPDMQKNLVGGEGLSYDEYLELQKRSGQQVRQDFEKAYYENAFVSLKGRIEHINKVQDKVCFNRIYLEGFYQDGNGFSGKEDHVWMERKDFEFYEVGTCLSFTAEIYRYVKKQGKLMDFGLRSPREINEIEEYELPSANELKLQTINKMICKIYCPCKEQCYGEEPCLTNEDWRKDMQKMLLDLYEK
ncbi:hypothetical protein [Megasphaera elsdenii]